MCVRPSEGSGSFMARTLYVRRLTDSSDNMMTRLLHVHDKS